MPNNTFIKLFHFLNADADGNQNDAAAEEAAAAAGYRESDGGLRTNKHDELQSI